MLTAGFFTFERSWNLFLEFIIELYDMQCLFARRSNKKQRRGRIIWNFTKGERLFSSYGNYMLLGVISQCAPILHLPKKAFLSPSLWSRREHTWTLSWKENLLICFENCLGVSYEHKQSRNRMMNTFIISNITPTCKR